MAVQQRTYTSAEFWEFVQRPENRGRFFERRSGELVTVSPSNPYASAVAVRISAALVNFVGDSGYVTGADSGYDISPDDTFAPEVAYISKARQPRLPETSFNPLPPDLAVEVKSPADSKRELRRKAEIYLAHGTRMVWLVFPQERRVEVYVPDADVIELGPDDTLDGGAVLPGFALAVSAIFPAQ